MVFLFIGHDSLVEVLINYGADVNAQDLFGRTPLFLAAEREGRLKVMDILLKNSSNPNLKDNEDQTPLFNAAKSGIFMQHEAQNIIDLK